jgi:hypothetical protein
MLETSTRGMGASRWWRRQPSARQPESPAPESVELAEALTSPDVCHWCGDRARVHVLEGYELGRPIVRRLCLQCATPDRLLGFERRTSTARLGFAWMVGVAGLVCGLIAVLVDSVPLRAQAGFGVYQGAGVLIGALAVVVGALSRTDLVAVAGTFVFGGAVFADWLGETRAVGVGWKQQLLFVVAVTCIALALLMYLRSVTRARRELSGHCPAGTPQPAGAPR